MSRVAAFVDAGYFWVQCSQILFRDKRGRGEVTLDIEEMRTHLLAIIHEEFPDVRLLRVYWYDSLGTDGTPTDLHRRIHEMDDFKVRYGTRNMEGKQKGIDGLLTTDLIGLAQSRSITDALLLSGDGDLTPGVAAAQALGVRVHRLEMGGPEATSPALRAEVDRNVLWPSEDVETFISPRFNGFEHTADVDGQRAFGLGLGGGMSRERVYYEDQPYTTVPSEESEALLLRVARDFSHRVAETCDVAGLPANSPIPADLDKRLLFDAKTALGRKLSPSEKVFLRNRVRNILLNGDDDDGIEADGNIAQPDDDPLY